MKNLDNVFCFVKHVLQLSDEKDPYKKAAAFATVLRAEDEVRNLIKKLDKAKEFLHRKEMQWSGKGWMDESFCVCCGSSIGKHAPDCELYTIIKDFSK